VKKIIIAIDGYSSTGKSTVAKQLARALNYIYVDTGAMYRAVGLFALGEGLITGEQVFRDRIIDRLPQIELQFKFKSEAGVAEMYLNGENVENAIRKMEVSDVVSRIAEIPEVRSFLVRQQQAYGKDKGLVMDGRDIGTVVFPEAELKIFMTASAKTRAQRRYDELLEKGEDVSFAAVLRNVQNRDEMDVNRKDSPLRQAGDAIKIDNSLLSKEEQFDKILELAQKRIAKA